MVIPEGPTKPNTAMLREPDVPAPVIRGERPLPTKENPSINLDMHEGDISEDKNVYTVEKIIDSRKLTYTTQYLVKWAG
jgi:hypothetical protein